jgi:hypothetical protein
MPPNTNTHKHKTDNKKKIKFIECLFEEQWLFVGFESSHYNWNECLNR